MAFSALLLTLSLATAQATLPYQLPRPAGLNAGFAAVQMPLATAMQCMEQRPVLEEGPELLRREIAYTDAMEKAEAIWGPVPDASTNRKMPTCKKSSVMSALKQVDRALGRLENILAPTMQQLETGSWIGPMRLCGPVITQARTGFDGYSSRPAVNITLSPEGRTAFAAITHNQIGKNLAIRKDGKIISAPKIMETIEGGRFQITADSVAEAQMLQHALSTPCPKEN